MSQIALVSNQHDDNVGIRMIPELFQQSLDVVVGLMLTYVVDEESSYSPWVAGGSCGSASLLTSDIPDLCLDGFCVNLNNEAI